MPSATHIGQARSGVIVALANDGGFLEHVDGNDFKADDVAGIVRIEIRFVLRDAHGKDVLTPRRRGEDEPYILIEETRHAPDGRLAVYNYDVVFPSQGIHYGYHHHIHEHAPYPHRQGFGVPGGHQPFAFVDFERDDVLWLLITKAFEIDAAIER